MRPEALRTLPDALLLLQTFSEWLQKNLPFSLPGSESYYEKPHSASANEYLGFLEHNSHVVYPAIAAVVLTLLVIGVIQAWRSTELDGMAKTEFKREIVLTLRRQVAGETVETIARRIGLEPFKTAKLLEEMQRDGILRSHVSSNRLVLWQVSGITVARVARS